MSTIAGVSGEPAAREPSANGQQAMTASSPAAPPIKSRRRQLRVGLGVAVIATGALLGWFVVEQLSSTTPVVALARDVPAGEVIEREDLVVANVPSTPALRTVPGQQLTSVVGKRAVNTLPAGTLLSPASIAERVFPAGGSSLVGVALTAGQMPGEPLRGGDRVRVVDTPTAQGDPPVTTPASIAATVASVSGPDASGVVVVTVVVGADVAADLAARAATGRVALVVDTVERG